MRKSGPSRTSLAVLAVGLVLLFSLVAAGSASAIAGVQPQYLVDSTADQLNETTEEVTEVTDQLNETTDDVPYTTEEPTNSTDSNDDSGLTDDYDSRSEEEATDDEDVDLDETGNSLLNERGEATLEPDLDGPLSTNGGLLAPVASSTESVEDLCLDVELSPVNSSVAMGTGQEVGSDSSESTDADDTERSGTGIPAGGPSDVVDAGLVGVLGGLTLLGGAGAAGGAGTGAGTGAIGGATGTAGAASSFLGQPLGALLRLLSGAFGLLSKLPISLLRYSRYDDSDPLNHETRRALFESIETDPGRYLTALETSHDVSLSTVRHHLSVLEDEGLVAAEKQHGKRRYYPAQTDAVELAAALDEPAKVDVLSVLAEAGEAHNGRLADALDVDPSTVTHHLSALESDGLVERRRDGRTVVNTLTPGVKGALADRIEGRKSTHPADDGPVAVYGDD